MTRDEAIDHLAVLAERMNDKGRMIYVGDIALEAVDMAIKILKKTPADKDEVIREAMASIENRVRHIYNQGYEAGKKGVWK